MKVFNNVWLAKQAGQCLQRGTIELPTLKPHQVQIHITHCGVCHSDLDIIDNSWQDSHYPVIPGHEIVGIISQLGSNVSGRLLGQTVGVSFQLGACGHCHYCTEHKSHFCQEFDAVGFGHRGGFAEYIQVDANFTNIIPNNLAAEQAAPMLCAGATIYQVIKKYPLKTGMRVGLIGLGGLGHLAVQFMAKLGCKVFVCDPDETKAADALRFGAAGFAAKCLPEGLDFILSTADGVIDIDYFIGQLKAESTLCFAGMPKQAMNLPLFPLIIRQKSISAINIGSPEDIAATLAFVARHEIKAQIELLPMTKVNEALARLRDHRPRYRLVLERISKINS